VTVHSALPARLTAAVAEVLGAAGARHVAHGDGEAVAAATAAAGDQSALAVIGPYRSRDVAEAVEATAPAGLPMLAPVATWAGVTRDDEPGCEDDPARHRGTVLRLVARDTVVATRIAAALHSEGKRAVVVAGDHEYGRQLDGQLTLAGLPRAAAHGEADLVVLAGLADGPEVRQAARLAPMPVIAFDGIQGAELDEEQEVRLALPTAPAASVAPDDLFAGVESARRAAELVASALAAGVRDRTAMLAELRRRGPFDDHGDPLDPPVWLWRVRAGWQLQSERPL
jgi:hypothetical protein